MYKFELECKFLQRKIQFFSNKLIRASVEIFSGFLPKYELKKKFYPTILQPRNKEFLLNHLAKFFFLHIREIIILLLALAQNLYTFLAQVLGEQFDFFFNKDKTGKGIFLRFE